MKINILRRAKIYLQELEKSILEFEGIVNSVNDHIKSNPYDKEEFVDRYNEVDIKSSEIKGLFSELEEELSACRSDMTHLRIQVAQKIDEKNPEKQSYNEQMKKALGSMFGLEEPAPDLLNKKKANIN
jgi:chromosome segregation ATPase